MPEAAVLSLPAQAGEQRACETASWGIDVSVCIANWNCRETLRGCLESLRQQSVDIRLETIVVDNGSSDGAADMVARDFPEVVLVRNPDNRGFSRANNQAAKHARGRFLFFLNNDTTVPAGTLTKLIRFADRHPEAGLIGPQLREADGKLQTSHRRKPTLGALLHRTSLLRWTGLCRQAYRNYRNRHGRMERTQEVEILMGAAMLTPRHVFFQCGGWDEGYTFGGEDIDLSVQIGKRGRVLFYAGTHIVHFGRVSTRLNMSYCSPSFAAGFTRSLRRIGYSSRALLAYKLLVTLDAPIQLAGKLIQYAWRRLSRRPAKAAKSLLAARGLWWFLTRGLGAFWTS